MRACMQQIADCEALCDGCSVEFLLAAGPAEALRPLGAVASGGETARVMMALKAAPASVLANSGAALEGQLPPLPLSTSSLSGYQSSACPRTSNVYTKAPQIASNFLMLPDAMWSVYSKLRAGDFGKSGPPVMILDELDSGVGARLGVPIAKLLSNMASARHAGLMSQIICISHLPQVNPIIKGHWLLVGVFQNKQR